MESFFEKFVVKNKNHFSVFSRIHSVFNNSIEYSSIIIIDFLIIKNLFSIGEVTKGGDYLAKGVYYENKRLLRIKRDIFLEILTRIAKKYKLLLIII